jgi:hypothetical protein
VHLFAFPRRFMLATRNGRPGKAVVAFVHAGTPDARWNAQALATSCTAPRPGARGRMRSQYGGSPGKRSPKRSMRAGTLSGCSSSP